LSAICGGYRGEKGQTDMAKREPRGFFS
jgi:hypothetical protein